MKNYNYLIKIEYDGTRFVGWQFQKNGQSIQERIEKILSKLLNSKIKIIGAEEQIRRLLNQRNFRTNKI